MAVSNPALVNPLLLSWAREQSGFAPESVAKRVNVKPERLLAWERGETKPTVRQAQDLAKFYHRPFGLFFLPQPPVLPPLAAEYRRLTGIAPGVESPELRLALRVMSYRREAALDLLEELGAPIAEFATAAHIVEGPMQVGRRLRELLGISVQEQLGWRDEWQAWRRWREAIEAAGVLVFQFPKVSLAQVRGVSLLKMPLPVIGVNSKESAPGARIFTLLHEFAHIALAVGQEEKAALGEHRDDAAWSRMESFAEEAAGCNESARCRGQLDAVPRTSDKAKVLVPQWLTDYRQWVADLRSWIDQLRQGQIIPFGVTITDTGIPIDERINAFATENRIKPCRIDQLQG